MKSFVTKVKNLSQKAAELKAAMEQLPPKVAEVRQTIAATTGQLQQLKSEIQFTVADLKVDNEERLSHSLQEINGGADVFAKAGFAVSGVDIEISPVQRMQVHLARLEDVHTSMLRSLITANQQRRTINAILSAMLQAKQMADTVQLDNLNYDELMVTIGPVPVVRLCWRPEEVHATHVASPPALPAAAPISMAPSQPQSVFGQSSFFERRTQSPPPAPAPEPAPVATAAPQSIGISKPATHHVEAHTETAPEVSIDPLARFKKMPDLSKSRR